MSASISNTSSPENPGSFLTSLTTHYKSLSDPITPHRFFQLCKDYNGGKLDEAAFYVAVYRLLVSTNASNLMPRFRAFLPVGWRDGELGWMERAVEEDVRDERDGSRRGIGVLASLGERLESAVVEGAAAAPAEGEVKTGGQVMRRGAAPESKGHAKASLERPSEKKKPPANGFRASAVPPPLALMESLTSRYEASIKSAPPKIEPEPVATTTALKTNKGSYTSTATPRAPAKTLSPTSDRPGAYTPSKLKSEPLTTKTGSSTPSPTPNPNLPSTASIRHLGPIYASTRAILSRLSKPYIHGLCGQHFGHPAEVQRHHNGQGGRPGCWEKSGKPVGEEGKWDADESCKVKLADLEYVRCREGWVVISWGRVGVDGVREGEEEERKGGEGLGVGDVGIGQGMGGGKGRKRKAVEMSSEVDEDDGRDEDEGEDIGEKGDCDFVEEVAQDNKRQKVVKIEDATMSISEDAAAARAVAFGLRTRK